MPMERQATGSQQTPLAKRAAVCLRAQPQEVSQEAQEAGASPGAERGVASKLAKQKAFRYKTMNWDNKYDIKTVIACFLMVTVYLPVFLNFLCSEITFLIY